MSDFVSIQTPEGVMQVQGTVVPFDPERFGAGGMPILDQLKMLATWGPMLGFLQQVATSATPKDKAVAVLEALLFAAGKTQTKVDDEVVTHLEEILKSPQGGAFFNWLITILKVAA